MSDNTNQSSAKNWWRWFDVRGRESGTIGFGLNRLTAIGLTFYLFLHLIVLGQLAQGPGAYDQFLELIHSPLFIFGELVVIFGVLYHGLNGIRIVVNSFGIAVKAQKPLFAAVVVISIIGTAMFALVMF